MLVMTNSASAAASSLGLARLLAYPIVGIPTALPAWTSETESPMNTASRAGVRRLSVGGVRWVAYGCLHPVVALDGARTEELRALMWDHVDLVGTPGVVPLVPPYIAVWRSVRSGGDTKTKKSRRTLALPQRCVEALKVHQLDQARDRTVAGERWQEHGLVFPSKVGTPLDPSHVRREFRSAIAGAVGVDAAEWTHGSYGTVSSPCCRTTGCRSKRSPGSSATAAQR
jgi:integrase